jgi:hypothetical protein
LEPDARIAYEFHADADVVEVGFIPHPKIPLTGASPDGLVGADGLIEKSLGHFDQAEYDRQLREGVAPLSK